MDWAKLRKYESLCRATGRKAEKEPWASLTTGYTKYLASASDCLRIGAGKTDEAMNIAPQTTNTFAPNAVRPG